MSLLYPLALLSLLSIIILIIIYLIKPNYQSKFVTSTFIWKLSLKFKRKKLPTSKFRNILLIICQILILALCSLLFAYPVVKYSSTENDLESILILDSSASMRVTSNIGSTRYERAIEEIKKEANKTFNNNGYVTVVISDDSPTILAQKVGKEKSNELLEMLDELSYDDKCGYATSNFDESISLCDNILEENPTANVYLYTDTDFSYVPKNVNLVKITDDSEYNIAILDAYVNYVGNYYDIIVEVASYGKDKIVNVSVDVNGANAMDGNESGRSIHFEPVEVECYNDSSSKIIYRSSDQNIEADGEVVIVDCNESLADKKIFSFSEILITIETDEEDSYSLDNVYSIYGGKKESIRVLYSSTLPNVFIKTLLSTLHTVYSDRFDIDITIDNTQKPDIANYDYYIFEHYIPDTVPTDGVCILLDPTTTKPAQVKKNYGFSIVGESQQSTKEIYLESDVDDSLLNDMDVSKVYVTKYVRIADFEESESEYKVLASIDRYPMLMYKNNGTSKVFVMSYSLHYSNMALRNELPFLFNNLLKTFTPTITEKSEYEVGEKIKVSTRGQELSISYNGTTTTENNFVASAPGVCDIVQTTDFGKEIRDSVYVRSPKDESNIFRTEDSLRNPYYEDVTKELYDDLLFYFSLALMTFVLLEYFLKNRDNS